MASLWNQNNLPARNDHRGGLRDIFDQYARDFFSPMLLEDEDSFSPRIEVKETEKGYVVSAELPGMKEEDIDITLQDNNLIISGEKKAESKTEEKGFHRSEFSYGSFYRSIPLREDVDNKNVVATYRNGILSVDLHKKEDGMSRTHKIKINK